jgi:ABC-type transporter lipoprotein component MlaA
MVRTGVNNFFGNLGDVWNLANNVAQLKLQGSAETFMRLNVNTFFGLGGLLDVATEAGIPRHEEDFGQTLGHWGVGAGPYVVLPLLGPSTLRDTAALPVDRLGDPVSQMNDVAWRNSLTVLRVPSTRARSTCAPAACSAKRRSTSIRSRAMRSCSAAAARSTTAIRRTTVRATARQKTAPKASKSQEAGRGR